MAMRSQNDLANGHHHDQQPSQSSCGLRLDIEDSPRSEEAGDSWKNWNERRSASPAPKLKGLLYPAREASPTPSSKSSRYSDPGRGRDHPNDTHHRQEYLYPQFGFEYTPDGLARQPYVEQSRYSATRDHEYARPSSAAEHSSDASTPPLPTPPPLYASYTPHIPYTMSVPPAVPCYPGPGYFPYDYAQAPPPFPPAYYQTPPSAPVAHSHHYHPYAAYGPPSPRASTPRSASGHHPPVPDSEIIYTEDATMKVGPHMRRRCSNCYTTDNSTWRRSSLRAGKLLCNKCGLYERAHSRPRPMDVVHQRAMKARRLKKGEKSESASPTTPDQPQDSPFRPSGVVLPGVQSFDILPAAQSLSRD